MSSRPSILYVEDDPAIAEMYRLGLDRAGYDVTIARDAEEAMKVVRRGHFDLALLDIMLPGIDGIELLVALRGDPDLRHLPVAILSNSELGRKLHDEASRLEILGWLTKSKSPPPVVARHLQRWLRQSRKPIPPA